MPTITTEPQVITGATRGFEFLKGRQQKIGLAFSGATLATTVEVGIINDADVFVPFSGGSVTSLPLTLVVESIPTNGITINVSGGTPNFNISPAGAAGQTGQ